MAKSEKTQVMRILDQKKILYESYSYDPTITDGKEVATILKKDPKQVFKTLVTEGSNNTHFVYVIPVCCTLDLKKAAKVSGVKAIEMLKQKDLLPLTGYIHGGCSMIGMKKAFPTFIDIEAKQHEKICFSAGKVGHQIEVKITDLEKIMNIIYADITIHNTEI